MGSIVSAITGGGGAGVNYQAGNANIQQALPGTYLAQDMNKGAVNRIFHQDDLSNQLAAQNGIQNQSQVYNQLQDVVAGKGPNPAQAQLAQATSANTANQAALMAGQRGSSANVGLMARQAAQQGGANQQQAAGQAATLQAQQSLGALGQAGSMATNQTNQQVNQTNATAASAQNESQILNNALAAQNNANVGMRSNMNQANAGIANTVAGGQMQLVGNMMGGAGAALMAQGGSVPHYADGGSTQLADVSTTNSPKSNLGKYLNSMNNPGVPNQPPTGMSGAGQAIGKGIGMGVKALYNSFGSSTPAADNSTPGSNASDYTDTTGQSQGGNSAQDYQDINNTSMNDLASDTATMLPAAEMEADGGMIDTITKMAPMIAMMAARGGKVPAMLSPGERYLSPDKVDKVAKGADPIKEGKKVPGKAKVKGAKNSYANDTIPATLEEGGIVLPRSVTESKHPHWAAHKFVADIMAKNGKGLPKK